MTDERIVSIAGALLAEVGSAHQLETMRRGTAPDMAALGQLITTAVENTLQVFHREEVALGERELGLFLQTIVSIFFGHAIANATTASAELDRAAKAIRDEAAVIERLEAEIARLQAAEPAT